MDSIRIDTGGLRIAINDDPDRVISFNPSDVAFAERYYHLLGDFGTKLSEYQQRAKTLDKAEVDENGVPVNIGECIALAGEICEFMRAGIDKLFGAGTSQTVFEEANTLDMFEQFFVGITPFIQRTRAKTLEKYAPQRGKRARKAMK